jgi:hypothetical protein
MSEGENQWTLGRGRSPHEVDRCLLLLMPKSVRQQWIKTGRPSRNNRHGHKGTKFNKERTK